METGRIFLKCLNSVILCLLLVACSDEECGSYSRLIGNPQNESLLTQWGDNVIFGGDFELQDLTEGGLVGPGYAAVRREAIGRWIEVSALSGDEVRLLGQDPFEPVGYFIGSASYRGIVVAQRDLDELLELERIPSAEVKSRSQRIAVICRDRR